MCVIYGLRARDSKTYFYIGSTKFTAEYRLRQHLDYIRTGHQTNRHLAHTVRKIGPDNIVVDVIEEVSPEDRFEREKEIIEAYVRQGNELTNLIYNGYAPYETEDDAYRSADECLDLAIDWVLTKFPARAARPQNQPLLSGVENVLLLMLEKVRTDYSHEWDAALRRRGER